MFSSIASYFGCTKVYEASEWMLSIIFDFSYMIYVFGCVAQ